MPDTPAPPHHGNAGENTREPTSRCDLDLFQSHSPKVGCALKIQMRLLGTSRTGHGTDSSLSPTGSARVEDLPPSVHDHCNLMFRRSKIPEDLVRNRIFGKEGLHRVFLRLSFLQAGEISSQAAGGPVHRFDRSFAPAPLAAMQSSSRIVDRRVTGIRPSDLMISRSMATGPEIGVCGRRRQGRRFP